ncbi:hypothetical protein EC950183_4979, partial [Escherichia coli 95.0183]
LVESFSWTNSNDISACPASK